MKISFLVPSLFFALCLTQPVLAQGSLTPPGVPSPSMKTLDQIEPAIPIDAAHTPGDTSDTFIITQPGSYYLTTNLTAVGSKNGIFINADDVSIDLRGFSLVGNGTGQNGIIRSVAGTHGLNVRNGSVRNWATTGIYVLSSACHFDNLNVVSNGINGIYAIGTAGEFSHCTVAGFTQSGFHLSSGDVLKDCVSTGNGTAASTGFLCTDGCIFTACSGQNADAGFSTGNGCVFSVCSAQSNRNGYTLGANSSLTDCSALNCGSNGIQVVAVQGGCKFTGCNVSQCYGVGLSSGSCATVRDCVATYNTLDGIVAGATCSLVNCSAFANGGNGFNVEVGSSLLHCTGLQNSLNGITTGDNCVLTGCSIVACLSAGISTGGSCTISQCNVSQNVGVGLLTGIRASVTGCTATANQTDGIRVGGDSVIANCHASANGTSGVSSAGIRTTGAGSRVEANQVRDNIGVGILTTGGDLIMRNFSGNNSTNYFPASGADFAPIQTPATATSPLANF